MQPEATSASDDVVMTLPPYFLLARFYETKGLTLEHRDGSRLVDGRLNIPQSSLFIPQSLCSQGERPMSRYPAEMPSRP